MAWFQKQNKHRRVSADRSRPVSPKPAAPAALASKRAGRYIMTALFLAGGFAILNFPRSGPRLKVGDTAQRDYRVRVQFEVADMESTLRARRDAEAKCPRIFDENSAHLAQIPAEMGKFLLALGGARRATLLAREGRVEWGLHSRQLEWLKKELDEKWIEQALLNVQAVLERAADLGVMDGSRLQQEMAADRYDIMVYADGKRKEGESRPLGMTTEYPAGLRHALEDDLRSLLSDKSPSFREAIVDMVVHKAKPTLVPNTEATGEALRAAAKRVPERTQIIAKDSIILPKGERVSAGTLDLIRREADEFDSLGVLDREREGRVERLRAQIQRSIGVTALFLVGFGLLVLFVVHFATQTLLSNTRVFGAYAIGTVVLLAVRFLEDFGFSTYWTPIVLAAMLLVVMSGPIPALAVTAFLAFVAGLVSDAGMSLAIPLMVGGFTAVLGLLKIKRQTDLVEAGVVAGAMQCVAVWAVCLTELRAGGTASWPVHESIAGLGGGIVAGLVLTGTLPYVERLFNVATDLRLFEWTDQNQPLLRKLAIEAPGSYHHSTVVANLAEAAAEEIGANALLTRAGAYFHDVGKLNRPEYYVENMGGSASRHDNLSPMISSMIITAHTKDGVELAARYGVPSPLRRIIVEHHGTCVVEYFYNKALKLAGEAGTMTREIFRYRGPKPRSPESGIIMLADASESAARSLENAAPSRIERLVHEIVQERLEDGQLDESKMNITDIRRVEKSLARSLMAVSHPRIRYPNQ